MVVSLTYRDNIPELSKTTFRPFYKGHLIIGGKMLGLSPFKEPLKGDMGPNKYPLYTPPKFNIAPEKWWLEDYFPTGWNSTDILAKPTALP